MKLSKKSKLLLILILLSALLLRLIFLDRIPDGISNDEYYFIFNAKNIFYDFLNLIKNGWNQSLWQNIVQQINSETSILLMAPILGLLPSTLFYTRLPYALIGVLTIYLLFKITQKNTKNTTISLLVALVAAFNPWSVYVNRTSFDAPVALLFFVLTFYLQSIPKKKFILLSAFTSLLAFNGYIGTKVIYLPYMLAISFYSWKYIHRQKFTKSFIITAIFSLIVTATFLLNLSRTSVGTRTSELMSPSSTAITSQVISERTQSLQSPLNKILLNRYTLYLKTFVDKYLYNFSTDILFLDGDHTFMVSLWKMGYFYYLDAFLIILGLIYLFNHHRSFLYLLLFSILLSPIPEAIRVDKIPAYAFHSAFQYPFLYILLGAGIYYAWNLLRHQIFHLLLIALYTLLFLNFINIYFFRYPVYQSEGFLMSQHLLANYLNFEQNKSASITIVSNEPESVFRNYLFFTKQYNYQNLGKIRQQYQEHPYSRYFQWGNLTITDKVPSTKDPQSTYIIDANISGYLYANEKHLSLTQLGDARELYKIYSGKTCQKDTLSTYTSNLTLKDLNLSSLSETDFCQKFVSLR